MLVFGGVDDIQYTLPEANTFAPEKGEKGRLLFLLGCHLFRCYISLREGIYIYISGQIIATSHDLTPNGGLVREIPLFQENLGW